MNHRPRLLCKVLSISHATYYRWRKHGCLPSEKRDAELLTQINAAFQESEQTYGARRVRKGLQKKGVRAGRSRVNRIMRQFYLYPVQPKRCIKTTNSKHAFPIAPNILARNFAPSATPLNNRWAGDVTFIWTLEGWLYLAVILDLTSRRVIGFATSANIDRHLTLDALRMAFAHRPNVSPALLFHFDRGSTYAAIEYRKALTSLNIVCSMSDVGECLDNAVIESFNATIKRELIDRRTWESHHDVAVAISQYITSWYNLRRLHSSLGYMSPVEYEIAIAAGRVSI
jgi:transposase InsO family protein